jgi:hypothetical protein
MSFDEDTSPADNVNHDGELRVFDLNTPFIL